MTATLTRMPTAAEFLAAERKLIDAGFHLITTVIANDARKDGVINFGKLFGRDAGRFWLNYKTIASLPA